VRAYIYGIAIIVLAAAAGSGVRANDDPAGRIIRSVGQRVAADPRLTVFEIHARTSGNGYVVFGKVEDLSVKEILLDTLRRDLRVDAIDSITVLPDPVLGPDTLGIIRIPVADVRRTPGVRKELVSQALLGTDVKLLERVKGFYRVRMRDGYHGWISEKSLRVVDSAALAAWRDSRRVIVTDLYCTIRSKPDTASSTVCRAVLGSLLKYRGTRGGWTDVERPDSTRGYADNASVRDYRSWLAERSRTPASLEKTAVRFLGIPYLWGGTSVRGFDCSGFTQTVYRWSGRELLRDASETRRSGVFWAEGGWEKSGTYHPRRPLDGRDAVYP